MEEATGTLQRIHMYVRGGTNHGYEQRSMHTQPTDKGDGMDRGKYTCVTVEKMYLTEAI
jgi:hypothetical protein